MISFQEMLREIERMEEHNDYAKKVTAPAKFHMMELREGWAPLCRVLRTPIPNEPFPRANKAKDVEGLAGQIFLEAGSRWAGILAVTGALGYGALKLWRSEILDLSTLR
jgi:hypothetical protein